MTKQEMMDQVRAQLALDLHCQPADFLAEGFTFVEAADTPGRRPFPREASHFDMLTMGSGIVVSATPDLLPHLQTSLAGADAYTAYSMPFVYGHSLYFLPDLDRLPILPAPEGFAFALVEQGEIPCLYDTEGFHNAIQYDAHHPRPDILAVTARRDGELVGIAGASDDSARLWQVGIDVRPAVRKAGLAAALVSQLTREILSRGYIPYYGTGSSNIASQRVAHRTGYSIAWMCSFRGRFGEMMTGPCG
jgi:GNAT superfamily N-acetyltransferase